jgi:hypothetical protein
MGPRAYGPFRLILYLNLRLQKEKARVSQKVKTMGDLDEAYTAGDPTGIRTQDFLAENQTSLAARRWGQRRQLYPILRNHSTPNNHTPYPTGNLSV